MKSYQPTPSERKLASLKSPEHVTRWLEERLAQRRIELDFEAVKCRSYSAGLVGAIERSRVGI